MSLELFLVLATAITGVITLADTLKRRGREQELPTAEAGEARPGFVVDFSRSFFPVLLIVLVIRSFLFEPYKIPSSSMVPTLYVGDFIFVSKFSYGIRLPVVHTKVVATGSPERGDVAVFRLPRDPSTNYIKRIIGLPGDRIEYRERRLVINGELMPLEPQGPFAIDDSSGILFRESIYGREHRLLHGDRVGFRPESLVVPDGCYFVMGDNRENSTDSRFPEVGCIPEGNLVGRASRIWFSWRWGEMPRWERIADPIR